MHKNCKPIFHPNFWPGGLICIWGGGNTNWNPNETIAMLCIRIAQMLQFDPGLTQESHRANPQAADWYAANKYSGLFPTDKQNLPIPNLFDADTAFTFH
jgi:ubiquitin-protein ligase